MVSAGHDGRIERTGTPVGPQGSARRVALHWQGPGDLELHGARAELDALPSFRPSGFESRGSARRSR